jgi:hypothetical protein
MTIDRSLSASADSLCAEIDVCRDLLRQFADEIRAIAAYRDKDRIDEAATLTIVEKCAARFSAYANDCRADLVAIRRFAKQVTNG